jgi:hypothetical protein
MNWLDRAVPSTMLTADGRRAWAFFALCGAGVTFTLFAAAAMYLNRENADNAFWLGMAGLGLVLIVLGSLGFLLGRRMVLSISRDGVTLDDRDQSEDTEDKP